MEKKKLTFTYRDASDYRPEFVMGVWGGLNPRGLIEMNFYTDHSPIPETSTHEITEKGELIGQPIERVPAEITGPVRIIKQGIIIDLPTAKHLHSWLDEQVKELETMIKEKE